MATIAAWSLVATLGLFALIPGGIGLWLYLDTKETDMQVVMIFSVLFTFLLLVIVVATAPELARLIVNFLKNLDAGA